MIPVTFDAEADAEVTEAAQYYEGRSAGLGHAFLAAVAAATQQIALYPYGCAVVGTQVRSKVLTEFPHSLLYAVEADRIRVVAVAHHRRRPQ